MTPPDPLRGWRFAAICTAILVATNATYVAWWLRTPPGHQVVACNFVNRGDTYAYIAWMKQAAQGHLLFLNLYDPSPQRRTLFHPLFLVLGVVARLLDADLALVYHAGRAGASLLLLLAARRFCLALLPGDGPAAARGFAFLTVATGLPALVPSSPIVAMFDVTLHAAAWALILAAATPWLRIVSDPGAASLLPAVRTGIAGAVLLLVHPFDAVSLALVLAVTSVVATARGTPPGRSAARLLVVASLMAPAAALCAFSLHGNPSLHAWAANPRETQLWHLLAFATLPVLAGAALLGPRRPATPYLLAWAGTSLALALAPLPSNQKFLMGAQAPLALLASDGVDALRRRGYPRSASVLLVAAFPVAALMLLIEAFDPLPTAGPRFHPRGLVEDLAALERLPEGIILAPPSLAHFVPAYAGRQVYLGHFDMTPDAARRSLEYKDFLDGRLQGADLAARGIRWVLLHADAPDRRWTGLGPVATSAWTRLYETVPPARIGASPNPQSTAATIHR